MNYTLLRSKRKTIAIHITQSGTVEVRAPYQASDAEIKKLIRDKEKWIRRHINTQLQRNQEKAGFSLNYGDTILLMGKEYPICAKQTKTAGYSGTCFYMPENLQPHEIKHIVIQLYKMLARNILTDKTQKYSRLMSVTPSSVKVNSAKTRWGSCSGKNSINFSWRLILAPEDAIDYVVVHELSHILEHNHSARFWAVVGSILPDYQERQNKLKLLQERLGREDWDI